MDRLFRRVFLCAVFVLMGVQIASSQASEGSLRVPLPADWKWMFGDDPSWSEESFDDSSWKSVTLPVNADASVSGGRTIVWLRGTFGTASLFPADRFYVLAGKMEGALEFYVNGVLLYSHGTFPPDFMYHTSSPKQFVVSPELLHSDRENVLAIRMFNEAGVFPIPRIDLGNHDAFQFDTYILRSLNIDTYVVFSVLCLFIGAFFLMQYAGNRTKTANLYYALSNLCFAVYFFVIGYDRRFLPMLLEFRIAKGILVPAVALLTVFFFEFFDDLRGKRLRIFVLGLGLATVPPFFIFPDSVYEINNIFTILLLIIVIYIGFMVTVTVRAARRKHPDSYPVAAGIVFTLAFSTFDIVCQFTGYVPLAWMQGAGIFCLNLAVFASLSMRSIRTEKSLVKYTAEVEEKTARLEEFIRNVQQVSEETSKTSGELSGTIESISDLMGRVANQSRSISSSVESQSGVVTETRETVMKQLSGVDEIFGQLETQARHIQEISSALEEMFAGIRSITSNLQGTAGFTEELGRVTSGGRKAVESSNEAMARIESLSKLIYQIIDTVDDLAGRTNLLSINAAIEAANSGSAGKGFAVVASEIKRLSHASGESVRKIAEYVSDISESISRGVEVNDEVRKILMNINEKTMATVERVQEAYGSVQEQKEASEDVLRNVEMLRTASDGIREQAGAQRDGGKSIRSQLDDLSAISETVRTSIQSISRENEDLEALVGKVSALSAQSSEVVKRLTLLLSRGS